MSAITHSLHILRKRTSALVIACLLCAPTPVLAAADLSWMTQGMPYADARPVLLEQGWKPIKNAQIEQSSLYAQDIYVQGYVEVVNCISMELDACTFRFSQKNQTLEIKTITRTLNVDTFKTYKKR